MSKKSKQKRIIPGTPSHTKTILKSVIADAKKLKHHLVEGHRLLCVQGDDAREILTELELANIGGMLEEMHQSITETSATVDVMAKQADVLLTSLPNAEDKSIVFIEASQLSAQFNILSVDTFTEFDTLSHLIIRACNSID